MTASLLSGFDKPPGEGKASPLGNYIQPNLGHGLRIWWAFFWRNTLISMALGIVLGLAVVGLYQIIPLPARRLIIGYSGAVLEYVVAIFVMYLIAYKKFRSFRIILTPSNALDSGQILQPTFKRTFRIWWTYTWRTVIYRIILSFALSVPLGFVTGAMTVIYPPLGDAFAKLAQVAIGGAVGLFTIYSNILDEDIAGFRVSLAPRAAIVEPAQPTSLPASPDAAGTAVL